MEQRFSVLVLRSRFRLLVVSAAALAAIPFSPRYSSNDGQSCSRSIAHPFCFVTEPTRSMQTNTETICDLPKIGPPTIPIVDSRPIRGSLGSFRAGYEEIEQLVSQLLDEIDAAYGELDSERAESCAPPHQFG